MIEPVNGGSKKLASNGRETNAREVCSRLIRKHYALMVLEKSAERRIRKCCHASSLQDFPAPCQSNAFPVP
jgi:hypothetical protein